MKIKESNNRWYYGQFGTIFSFKDVKNSHAGVLLLVQLPALACNFTKSSTSQWVFFAFLK